MKKNEFLRELEISLKGKLSETDINEILSDYNDIFEDGLLENRDEDEISMGIGSPAAIARAIIDDSASNMLSNNNISVAPDTSHLAPMWKRFLAYMLDTALIVLICIIFFVVVVYKSIIPSLDEPGSMASIMAFIVFIPYLLIFMALGFGNIFTALELWIFKGYTFGKWVMKIRVVRSDDDNITFWDAFLRDILLKCGASLLTSGMLNMVSFIMGSATADHKTIHDLAAKTKVINIKR